MSEVSVQNIDPITKVLWKMVKIAVISSLYFWLCHQMPILNVNTIANEGSETEGNLCFASGFVCLFVFCSYMIHQSMYERRKCSSEFWLLAESSGSERSWLNIWQWVEEWGQSA